MSHHTPPSSDARDVAEAQNLRQKAEVKWLAVRDKSPETFGDLTIRDTHILLHDLHVHQIELELQNEELRQAKDALDASRARYVDLYDLAPVSYCSVSEAGLITQTNLSLATQLGVARTALVNRPLSSYVLREDQDAWYRMHQRCLKSGETQSVEVRMHDAQKAPFWASLSISSSLGSDGAWEMRVVVRDVSAIRAMHDKLRASQERYRTLAQDMPLYVAAAWSDGTLTYVNAALAALVGSSEEDMVGRNYFDFLSAEDKAMGKARLAALTPEQSVETHEQRWIGADGQEETQEWTNRAFFDDAGNVIRLQSVGRDISERKSAQAKQQLISKVFEHAREGITITDSKGTIIVVNEAFLQITGYSRDEVIGKNPRILRHCK